VKNVLIIPFSEIIKTIGGNPRWATPQEKV